jgi:hypothetical protein
MIEAQLSPDARTLTVWVPLQVRWQGGRKHILAPQGAPAWAPRRHYVESTLVKALARAYRWRRLLEDGTYATIEEIAAAEKINCSYVSRVLRLTLLATNVVEALLDGRAHEGIALAALFRPFPIIWQEQEQLLRQGAWPFLHQSGRGKNSRR